MTKEGNGRIAMNKLASIAFAVALSMGSLNLARADQAGPDWMPAQQVIEQVLKSGYTQVTKLEADDGRWEGDGRPSEHYPGKAFDSLDHRPPSVDGGCSG